MKIIRILFLSQASKGLEWEEKERSLVRRQVF